MNNQSRASGGRLHRVIPIKTRYITFGVLVAGILVLGANTLPPPYPVTCTDAQGRVLYIVNVYRVTNAQGVFLGTCKNGEVRDSTGRLIAYHGDPGLLYKFVASGHTP